MQNNKCVIYARVSSKEQEETGYSLPAQEKLLKEHSEKKNFKVEDKWKMNDPYLGIFAI